MWVVGAAEAVVGAAWAGPGLQVARAKKFDRGDRRRRRPTQGPQRPRASRTDEEIQIVFDRYKSAFYRDYNRTLRINPTLQARWCCADD